MMCQDAHVCKKFCKQLCKAPGLTYKLTNYKLVYSNDSDFGLLLDIDVVKAKISSNSEVYGYMCSTVSTFFDLWSLGDHLSRIYPCKLTDAYYIHDFLRNIPCSLVILHFNVYIYGLNT